MILVIILAVWTYMHFWTSRENAENSTLISIGSVWLPVYPGAVTENTASTKRDGATESTFRFRSTDSASKVLDFYAPALRTAHFRNYSPRRTASGGMLQAMGTGRNTVVMITAQPSPAGSETQITTLDR